MTWNPGAWAIDGGQLTGSLARIAERAAVKESGIVSVGDLKVTQLSGGAGNGVQIAPGGAVVENRYVTDSGQMYAVENVAAEVLGPSTVGWPSTNPGVARSHLVCVSIGDPQYSTAGHPWLTDAIKNAQTAETWKTFQYVRTVIIPNVPAGTIRVEDLPVPPAYPVYAIARLDLPGNWTTIADAQIVDLRTVANPRTKQEQWNVAVAANDLLSVPVDMQYEIWPDNSVKNIYIPKWATKVYVTAWIQSFLKGANILADARTRVAAFDTGLTTRKLTGQAVTFYSIASGSTNSRHSIFMGDPIVIPASERGTTRTFLTEATLVDHTAMNNNLKTDIGTSVMINLRFVEEAV